VDPFVHCAGAQIALVVVAPTTLRFSEAAGVSPTGRQPQATDAPSLGRAPKVACGRETA